MYTPVDIVNIGLSKIGAARIRQMDGARNSVEAFCASNYEHWARSELAKHRWLFATRTIALTQVAQDQTTTDKVYSLPTEVVRPIRDAHTSWQQEGRFIRTDQSTLTIKAIVDTETENYDALFVEVLACRVAVECCEYITQSNTKKQVAEAMYEKAVTDARRFNAFTRGPELAVGAGDYPFLTERYQLL